jgi:hypothetical protein
MTSIYVPPQGRLTPTSNTPVMAADATGATSVYYTPYQGNIVPIYDGANMQSYTFGQLTMALNTSNQLSGKIYDLFVFLNSSVVTIGAGPAWSSATAGSSSRGTGSGTTQLQQTDGLWVNANTITLTNGATSYSSIPVGEAAYVGSVYMTANGQTGINFKPAAAAGGSNNIIGIYNAYNRTHLYSLERELTTDWTYASATWRPTNGASGNVNNRVTWLDGLGQSAVRASCSVQAAIATGNDGITIGVSLNSTTATPNIMASEYPPSGDSYFLISPQENFAPQLGLNYLQAMEASPSGVTATFYAVGIVQSLTFEGEY